MNSNTMSTESERECKHIQILNGIKRLDDAICSLERLVCRIKGQPTVTNQEEEPMVETKETLASVLGATGDKLYARADSIENLIHDIEALLF